MWTNRRLFISLSSVSLENFGRTIAHPIEFPAEENYVDLHGHTLSLIFLEGLVDSFFPL